MFSSAIRKQEAFRLFEPYLPSDHARQVRAEDMFIEFANNLDASILDLGCGVGDSEGFFRDFARERRIQLMWRGVDIQDSPEVRQRLGSNSGIDTYDGVHLPYADDYFEVVYCDQVLEHVRSPDALLKDVSRVLKPGGVFVGTVAYLEPFHSLSLFNFTPYTLVELGRSAGLDLVRMRPGVDGVTLIFRLLFRRPVFFEWFIRKTSPLNALLAATSALLRLRPSEANYLKLMVAGHLGFAFRKPIDQRSM